MDVYSNLLSLIFLVGMYATLVLVVFHKTFAKGVPGSASDCPYKDIALRLTASGTFVVSLKFFLIGAILVFTGGYVAELKFAGGAYGDLHRGFMTVVALLAAGALVGFFVFSLTKGGRGETVVGQIVQQVVSFLMLLGVGFLFLLFTQYVNDAFPEFSLISNWIAAVIYAAMCLSDVGLSMRDGAETMQDAFGGMSRGANFFRKQVERRS